MGYLYKSGTLFNTGMWLANKLGDQQVLTELRFADSNSMQDCYMHRLALQEGPNWFQHVLLVSSSQDEWVPYDSARI